MKYYIAQGQQSSGPYDVSQLRSMAISPDTLVWNNTMPQWTRADQVEELRCQLFGASPELQQPYGGPWGNMPQGNMPQGNMPQGNYLPCPPTYLWLSILTTIMCMPVLGIIAIVFSCKVEPRYNRGDYQQALSASKTALTLNLVAIALGLVLSIGGCLLTLSGFSYLSMLNSAL